MTAYSGGSPGANIFGEAPDPGPVPAEFASLWPAGERGIAAAPSKPGHVQNDVPRTVEPAPDRNGKRPRRRKVKPKPPPDGYPAPRRTKPGSDQVPRTGRVQQGK